MIQANLYTQKSTSDFTAGARRRFGIETWVVQQDRNRMPSRTYVRKSSCVVCTVHIYVYIHRAVTTHDSKLMLRVICIPYSLYSLQRTQLHCVRAGKHDENCASMVHRKALEARAYIDKRQRDRQPKWLADAPVGAVRCCGIIVIESSHDTHRMGE